MLPTVTVESHERHISFQYAPESVDLLTHMVNVRVRELLRTGSGVV